MLQKIFDKSNNKKNIELLLLFGSYILRIIIQLKLPIYARTEWLDDDGLMMDYAYSILSGEWLGEYNVHTLNKNPGFSFFLALCKLTGIPYMLALGILVIFASFLFFLAIKKYTNSFSVSYFCMLLVMFSPIMFDDRVGQQVYRMSIIPPLVLTVVSCYLLAYFGRREVLKKCAKWMTIAGFFFAFFELSREDSAWFKCFLFGATAVLLVLYIIDNRKKRNLKRFVAYFIILLIPFMMSFACKTALKITNYIQYGVYTTNDFSSTGFVNVCKDIASIKPIEEKYNVYVSYDTLMKACDNSKTLNMIRGDIEYYFNDSFPGVDDEEIHGGFFVWIIRYAASKAGYYNDAVEADAFFYKIHNELTEAFTDGRLEKREAIVLSGLAKPLLKEQIPEVLKYSIHGLKCVANYYDIDAKLIYATGKEEGIEYFESMTNSDIPTLRSKGYFLEGWIFSTDGRDIRIEVKDDNGGSYILGFCDSPDVYDVFKEEYAKKCRFEYIIPDAQYVNKFSIEIIKGDTVIYSGPIQDISIDDESVVVCIDENRERFVERETDRFLEDNIYLINKIIKLYKLCSKPFFYITLLCICISFLLNMYLWKKKEAAQFSFLLVEVGLGLTIFADVLVVSINYFETYPDIFLTYYIAGVYPIWNVLECCSICMLYSLIKKIRNRKDRSDETDNTDTVLQ